MSKMLLRLTAANSLRSNRSDKLYSMYQSIECSNL